eukprot:751872-Pelagomonas_calceolata.AAC.1
MYKESIRAALVTGKGASTFRENAVRLSEIIQEIADSALHILSGCQCPVIVVEEIHGSSEPIRLLFLNRCRESFLCL